MVARRIEEAVAAIGDRERVIASTDCGFGTFAGREWVAASIVWPKLKTLREGADLASQRLWGKKGGVPARMAASGAMQIRARCFIQAGPGHAHHSCPRPGHRILRSAL